MVIGERLVLSALLTGLYLPGIEALWLKQSTAKGSRGRHLGGLATGVGRDGSPSDGIDLSGKEGGLDASPRVGRQELALADSEGPEPAERIGGGPRPFSPCGSQSWLGREAVLSPACRAILEGQDTHSGAATSCWLRLDLSHQISGSSGSSSIFESGGQKVNHSRWKVAASLLAREAPTLDSAASLLRRHGFSEEACRLEMPGLLPLALQLVLEDLVLTPYSEAAFGVSGASLCEQFAQGFWFSSAGGPRADSGLDQGIWNVLPPALWRWGPRSSVGAAPAPIQADPVIGGARRGQKGSAKGSGSQNRPEAVSRAVSRAGNQAQRQAQLLAPRGLSRQGSAEFPLHLIGIVGSRNPSSLCQLAARSAAKAVLRSGATVITGGAAGVDLLALKEVALSLTPRAVILHPWGLFSREGSKLRRAFPWAWHLGLGGPWTDFESRLAHQRNRLIYSLSGGVFALGARFKEGGTWSGAVEGIRGRLAPLSFVSGCGDLLAEESLAALGAFAMTLETLESLAPRDLLPGGGVFRFKAAQPAQGSLFGAAPAAEDSHLGGRAVMDQCGLDAGLDAGLDVRLGIGLAVGLDRAGMERRGDSGAARTLSGQEPGRRRKEAKEARPAYLAA